MKGWAPLLLFFFLGSIPVKAAEPIKIWILAIGISEYEYLPDLNYADDDAEAFLKYARESLGTRYVSSQVQLLLNKQATGSAIHTALEWMLRNAKAKDRTYIYFSGHGGYEDITDAKLGYLHAYDSYDATYANGGNVKLDWLEQVLRTLSNREIETFLILDACHAGKIMNSDYLFLNNSLASQIPNINKVLSAQGGQKSFENSKWGGGHGVFTYYLLEGLLGAADIDPTDGNISLVELNRHLLNHVPQETNQQQIPIVIASDQRKMLFPVIKRETSPVIQNPAVVAREEITKQADFPVIPDEEPGLAQFKQVLQGKKSSFRSTAEALGEYQRSVKSVKDPETKIQLTDLLVAHYIDQSQKYINTFMGFEEGSPNQLKEAKAEYDLFKTATQILALIENRHPTYSLLESRRIFFETEIFHNEIHKNEKKLTGLKEIIQKLEYAISLDSRSTYLKYQAGVLKYHAQDFISARNYLRDAAVHSPMWSFPDIVIGNTFVATSQHDSALFYFRKALTKTPKTPALYENLGDHFQVRLDHESNKVQKRILSDSIIYFYSKAVEAVGKGQAKWDKYEVIAGVFDDLYQEWQDPLYCQKAINYYKLALSDENENNTDICLVISSLHMKLDKDSPDGHFFWGVYYSLTGEENPMGEFSKAFELGFSDWEYLRFIPAAQQNREEFKILLKQYQKD